MCSVHCNRVLHNPRCRGLGAQGTPRAAQAGRRPEPARHRCGHAHVSAHKFWRTPAGARSGGLAAARCLAAQAVLCLLHTACLQFAAPRTRSHTVGPATFSICWPRLRAGTPPPGPVTCQPPRSACGRSPVRCALPPPPPCRLRGSAPRTRMRRSCHHAPPRGCVHSHHPRPRSPPDV